MPTYYLDYENGDDANDGSDWANAWQTCKLGATEARIDPGDVIRIAKSPDPTSIGNGTWTNDSREIVLAAAQTDTIDNCETAWTAQNGATVTREAVGTAPYSKQGSYHMEIKPDATPGTDELQAYFATGTLDLSAYQKITFWFRADVVIADGETWEICLCSDAVGATPVDTFKIPAINDPDLDDHWMPLTLTKEGGGNLGAAIESIALYTGSSAPTASEEVYVDNFSACTSTGLNLQSLISKNDAAQGGTEHWHGLKSIDGVTLIVDTRTDERADDATGRYYGTTETVTTYKRETVKLPASMWGTDEMVMEDGSAGNLITFSGGWDTGTTIQDGETLVDGLAGVMQGLSIVGVDYIRVEWMGWYRFHDGLYVNNSTNVECENVRAGNNTNNGVGFGGISTDSDISVLTSNFNYNNGVSAGYSLVGFSVRNFEVAQANSNHDNGVELGIGRWYCQPVIGTVNGNEYGLCLSLGAYFIQVASVDEANWNTLYGVYFYAGCSAHITEITQANNNKYSGVYIGADYTRINKIVQANDNLYYGVRFFDCGGCWIGILSTSGNGTSGIYNTWGHNVVSQASIAEATVAYGWDSEQSPRLSLGCFDGDPDDNRVYIGSYGTIVSQATNRHTASGIAWTITPLSQYRHENAPIILPIAKIACNADKQVTVNVWVQLEHATDVAAALVCRGEHIAGVAADVSDTKTADLNWEELQIQFTPTDAGGVEIEVHAWWEAAEADVYVDDMTITQAA